MFNKYVIHSMNVSDLKEYWHLAVTSGIFVDMLFQSVMSASSNRIENCQMFGKLINPKQTPARL